MSGERFLVISPSWIGDIIMSQSFLAVIHKMHPEVAIDVYAPAFAEPVLRRMPEVENVIINPFKHGELNLGLRMKEGRRLSAHHYSRAYVLPNTLKAALVPFFAKIPQRIGYKGESRYGLINRMRRGGKDFSLMVERYVALAFEGYDCGCTKILTAYDRPKLLSQPLTPEQIARFGIDFSKPVLVFGCGANWGETKAWPANHFAAVAKAWIQKGGVAVAIGSPKDAPIGKDIEAALGDSRGFINLCGQTRMDEAIDILAQSRAAVCNDSGLLHTAAAVGIPVIALYGSTSATHTPPLAERYRILSLNLSCSPCFKKVCPLGTRACLTDLKPEMVLEALSVLTDF